MTQTSTPAGIPAEHIRSQTFKDTLHYLSATLISTGVGLFRSMAIPFLFSPAQMGVWNLMNVIISYGANVHLGILNGMNKLIPLLRGQGKLKEIKIMQDSVFWAIFFLAAGAALIVIISSFFVPRMYMAYLWVASAIVFLQLIFNFQFFVLRADSSFVLVSRGIFIMAIGAAFFVVSLAFLFKDRILGGLLGLAIANICGVVYWFVKPRMKYPLQIDFLAIRQSFVVGLPLIMIGVLDVVFISIDRWIIVANLGIMVLGYYSLGIMVNNIISVVPSSVASVLFPKMLERFGAERDYLRSKDLLLGALRLSAMGMLILICCVSFGLPLILKLLLPKYLPSVPIIKILVLGSFFYSLATIAGNYLISVDKQRWLTVIQIASIGLLLFLYSIALKLGQGIMVLSWITAIGYSFFGFCYISLGIYFVQGRSFRKNFRFMMGLLLPFSLMTVMILEGQASIVKNMAFTGYLFSSVEYFLLTICVVLPVAWLLNRDRNLEIMIQKEFKLLLKAVLRIKE